VVKRDLGNTTGKNKVIISAGRYSVMDSRTQRHLVSRNINEWEEKGPPIEFLQSERV